MGSLPSRLTTMSPRAQIWGRGLGYRPDQPDDGRDLLFVDHRKFFGLRQSVSGQRIDLSRWVKQIYHQGPISSCVSNAGFAAIQLRHAAWTEGDTRELPTLMGARLWGYYLARDMAGVAKFDVGCRLRDFFRCLNHYGFLLESEYSLGYDVEQWRKKPPPLSFRRAIDRRQRDPVTGRGATVGYYRIYGEGDDLVEQICESLEREMPVVFGTNVTRAFVAGELGERPVERPRESEPIAGGHAMYVVGYDPDLSAFRVVSSWGEEWGDKGACWMDESYFTWGSTQDIWAIHQVPER